MAEVGMSTRAIFANGLECAVIGQIGEPSGDTFGIRVITATGRCVQGTTSQGPRAQLPPNKTKHLCTISQCARGAVRRAFGIRAPWTLVPNAYEVRGGSSTLVAAACGRDMQGERLKEPLRAQAA